jgi:saccharopine dehydrogenase-like NADP-dependent oxidoreductase
VIRGSLRYEGNPAFVKALIDLGWLDTEQKDWLKDGLTWAEIFQKMTGAEKSAERYFTALSLEKKPI